MEKIKEKQQLIIDLKALGLESRDFSILSNEKPDCFNLVKNRTGDGFSVYYLDERGNFEYNQDFITFSDASCYMLTLIKQLKY